MAVLDVLNLNLGTEQNPNWVAHDIHDKRISTTAVTTATHLLATNDGVTAMNPISAANLASVLGATYILIPIDSDLNDYTKDGAVYRVPNSGVANSLINKPSGFSTSGLMYVRHSFPSLAVIQVIIASGSIYMRTGNTASGVWQDWNTFTYNLPDFYKNYSTISGLAEGIAQQSSIVQVHTVNTTTQTWLDDFYNDFITWNNNRLHAVIIHNTNGWNGCAYGFKPSNRYAHFVLMINGLTEYKYINTNNNGATSNFQ